MEIITIIGTIAAVVAAVVGILSLRVSIVALRDSKRNIYKRIEKKERQIEAIDRKLINRYGFDSTTRSRGITPLDAEKDKLQQEIADLKRLL